MKMMTCPGWFALAALGALAGCTETLDSKNIRTQGISATIEAIAGSETSTTVSATLKAGGDESNTYIRLNSGDTISAEANGQKVELQPESTGVYEGEFDTGAADTEFKVMLERDDDDDALGNVGTLPAPFTVGALPTMPAPRGEALTITWSPSGTSDSMHIRVDGQCIFFEDIDVSGDPGTYTLNAGTLNTTDSNAQESCEATVTVTRSRDGSTDKVLDPESSFVLNQVRTARFTTAP